MYNYHEAMKDDVLNYVKENKEYIKNKSIDDLYDDMFLSDSITGNGSGSYTFSSYQAKENVQENEDLLKEALQEFCVDAETVADKFMNGDYEYFDVTIRCYILGEVLYGLEYEIQEILNSEEE